MSVSSKNIKNVWQEHRDSLTRIKSQLSDGRSPIKSPTRSPVGRTGHSPYGRYRQSTPPYLPRIDTPPENDIRRKPPKLRGNRYEVVPPVRDTRKFESRNDDYDSWGEESDDESEADPGTYMPQPYPYPVQSYPYGPPQPFMAAPIPVFYPPPPPRRKSQKQRQKDENDYNPQHRRSEPGTHSRAPLKERYEDLNRSEPKSIRKKQNRVHFEHPPANGYYGYPMYPFPGYYGGGGGEERKPKKDSRYKYIHPRDTPFSPAGVYGDEVSREFRNEPERLMSYYMKDHPLFSESFVNWLINDTLDEIIPDLLIDVVKEVGRMPGTGFSVLDEIRDDILSEELGHLMHGVVRSSLNEMVDEHMLYTQTDRDPLESFLTRLLYDAVQESSVDIVRETVRELARDYVEDKHHEIVFDDLFNDFMYEIGADVVEDTVIDVIAEDFIRDVVIEEEVAEEVPVIAKEVLSHYDTKVMRRELKEVSSHAGDKLVETFMIDYLLTLLARQGKVWTESDHANKYMDAIESYSQPLQTVYLLRVDLSNKNSVDPIRGLLQELSDLDMVTNILLGQLFGVTTQRRKTLKNSPVRKIHQKAVTDVALDVLLQQLTASLDEDMCDVDEYERDIPDEYGSNRATPVSIKFIR